MDQPEPLCSHSEVLGSPSNPDVAWLLSTASPPPYPEATFWPSSYIAINIHQLSLASSRLLEAHFPGEATGGGREGFWRHFWTRQLLLGAGLGAAGLVAPFLLLAPANGAGEIQPAVSRNWLLTPWAGRAPCRRCVRCLHPCGQGDEQSMLSRGGFEFKARGSEPLLLASANKMLRLIKRPDPGGRFKQDALGLEARGLSAFPRAQTCERPGSGRFAACGGDGAELPAQVLHRHR